MSDGELNRLELEVEDARARLAADLNRLRAPETFAEFKRAVVDEVSHSKDEWIEQGKAIATDRARHLLDDLKRRAGEPGCGGGDRRGAAVAPGPSSSYHISPGRRWRC